jgi:hypothetical protein
MQEVADRPPELRVVHARLGVLECLDAGQRAPLDDAADPPHDVMVPAGPVSALCQPA